MAYTKEVEMPSGSAGTRSSKASKGWGRLHYLSAASGKKASFKGFMPPKRDHLPMKFRGPPCRTLRDMTEAEIVAIEREYGARVIRPI